MWVSLGVEAKATLHYKNYAERETILLLFQTLQERYLGSTVIYDGPAKHHEDGNDFIFMVPVQGLMSSQKPTLPEALVEEIHALKRLLFQAQLDTIGAGTDEYPLEISDNNP